MQTKLLSIAGLALALALGACAAPSQPLLDLVNVGCAKGNQDACNLVPVFQAKVVQEQNQQAAAVAAGILGIAVSVADAALSDPYCCYAPRYYHHYWRR